VRAKGIASPSIAPDAMVWMEGAPLLSLHLGARAFIPVALAGAVLFTLAPSTPTAAATPKTTEAAQIISIAKSKLGDHWRYGASGPNAFDCSGLVMYAFRKAGDYSVIKSGRLRSARALYRWFMAHGLASTSNPKIGDLVVWGGGSHIGIYIGNGKAISTLTNGVRIHGVHAVRAKFTAYLHTGMSGTAARGTFSVTAAVAKATTTIRHTLHAINLRRGPGLDYARVRSLAAGARLTVIGRQADSHGRAWLHVRVAGRTGWVAGWLTR
jgi:NlpC/P60 family/Bacterial SH3 domain